MFQWHNGRGYVEEPSGSDRGGVKSLFELERKIFFNFVFELETKIRNEMKRKNIKKIREKKPENFCLFLRHYQTNN
jgi:hypothetical protein